MLEDADGVRAGDFVEHLLALVHAGDDVEVVAHDPGGLDVAGGGDEVGEVHEALAAALHHHVLQARDVAGRRADGDAGQQLGGAIHGVQQAGGLQGLPVLGQVAGLHAQVGAPGVGQVPGLHHVAGVGEAGHGLTRAVEARAAAGVVEV